MVFFEQKTIFIFYFRTHVPSFKLKHYKEKQFYFILLEGVGIWTIREQLVIRGVRLIGGVHLFIIE